ncbi:MAG: S-layer homology domain-containing protein [bacterium]|nr:S-layer homology domain-containing protein [bacterium]
MFTTLKYRRHVAVLVTLAMVASVLVAVPAVAADPTADYTATFDACGAAPDSGFTDVPMGHANAGDIDCIAYYGVTKGTSATTYSPVMSVTREQMALFLTRLAGLVDIPVDADPVDAGFGDIGDLSEESQTAINQLADLGITRGTSATTYSPSDDVTRAQMALFVQRLMNQMTPQADGEIGLSSTTQYGHTPSDVAANSMDADIGSPFTDLGRATKDEFDAITQLWELGVAAGISDTSYSPGADITRAAMAGFMAAVLDHSNTRPAGLSIQATPREGWGTLAATVMVSVRSDSFGAVENRAVDIFSTTSANNGLRNDGTCNFGTNADDVNFGDFIDGDCVWNENDDATDVDGNLIVEMDVLQGSTRLIYAWIGAKDGDKFDADTADEATVSVTAKKEQARIDVSSTINDHADTGYAASANRYAAEEGPKVDLRAVGEVTFTAQLEDEDGNDVKRAGIAVRVEYLQGREGATPDDTGTNPRDLRNFANTHAAEGETNENGQFSFTVQGPADDRRNDDQIRADDILFIVDGLEDGTGSILWVEEDPALTSTTVESPVYVLAGASSAVRTTVYLWDQYGDPHQSHRSQKAVIAIDNAATPGVSNTEILADPATASLRQVISRGYASWRRTLTTSENNPVNIIYDVRRLSRNSNGLAIHSSSTDADPRVTYNDGRVITGDGDSDLTAVYGTDNALLSRPGANQEYKNILNSEATDLFDDRTPTGSAVVTNDGSDSVQVVNRAVSTNVGNTILTITAALVDSDEFLVSTEMEDGSTPNDENANRVYSYDSGDIFIDSTGNEGVEITMASFEGKIGRATNPVTSIQVIAYDVDGTSIFRLVSG